MLKGDIRYLGMKVGTPLNFKHQLKQPIKKSVKVCTALSRFMTNVGGPTTSKQGLYNEYNIQFSCMAVKYG